MLKREQFLHRLDHLVEVDRLVEDLGRAKLLGDREEIHRGQLTASGHGDDLAVREGLADLADRFEPLLLGHQDVRDDKFGGVLLHLAHPLQAVAGLIHLISCLREETLHKGANLGFVIDDQYLWHVYSFPILFLWKSLSATQRSLIVEASVG